MRQGGTNSKRAPFKSDGPSVSCYDSTTGNLFVTLKATLSDTLLVPRQVSVINSRQAAFATPAANRVTGEDTVQPPTSSISNIQLLVDRNKATENNKPKCVQDFNCVFVA